MLEGCVPWPGELAEHYRRQGYWQGRPLGELLHEACAEHGDRVAVVCGDRRMTYAELSAASSELAGGFLDRGIGPLDRVVVQLPNITEFVVVMFALFRIGAIPVLALPGHRRNEILHLTGHSQAVAYVVVDRAGDFDYRDLAREVVAARPHIREVFVAGDAAEFTALDSAVSDNRAFPRVDPSEPALFLLSGGTTGLPKLIPRTHDDYAYNMRATAEAMGVGRDDVYLAVNPAAHNAALGCPGVIGTILVGGRSVLTSSVRPDHVFDLISRENVTISTVVPPVLRLWMDAAQKSGADLSGVTLQVGSSKVDPTQADQAIKLLNCTLSQWFGIGEGLLTHTRLDDPREVVINSEGRPLCPDDEVMVVDTEGRPVPAGVEGELVTRGPYTIRGYYRAEEKNAEAFTADSFFRTGDLAKIRADGNIVVVGRLKDIINRSGEKVPAEEVEEYLLAHPAVADAALVGVADQKLGERSYAFVVLREDVKPPQLKAHLRECGLATYKIPDKLIALDKLPLTPVGKIDKGALRDLAAHPAG
ncbi:MULTISPECIES: (2,3-dihydroxybenzoyl)adenylate synthase [Streptomyces]|uniref:Putative 3-hydroxy-quinaldate-AMP-Ligase n=1 Tax=Streptomyces alboflavus TaxID=67267 RepID=A0A1Z1WKR2_9ACTN|nr:(2,3-dihydroxybenzoyl)adenylate synthase [Streptomyces alboflavus]ARX87041.1 putative 3-hydroxy-quinaldate-AMP-Ligase [Streptomyces alboflavus]